MSIDLNTIKLLREESGAGMVNCKEAITEANGDIKLAMEILRKKGIAKAAERSGRQATEGIIKVAVNKENNKGYLLELNSETDFVSRGKQFQEFSQNLIELMQEKQPANCDELLALSLGQGTVKAELENLSGVTGEKLEIKNCDLLTSNGTIAAYSHMNGRIGVLVALDKPASEDLAHDIAMQIAAANPKYISPDEVPAEETDKEKEIYRAQLIKEGKPANIIDKILVGKIKKYFSEVCLIEQEYIKDDKKKVAAILGEVKVEKFIRRSL